MVIDIKAILNQKEESEIKYCIKKFQRYFEEERRWIFPQHSQSASLIIGTYLNPYEKFMLFLKKKCTSATTVSWADTLSNVKNLVLQQLKDLKMDGRLIRREIIPHDKEENISFEMKIQELENSYSNAIGDHSMSVKKRKNKTHNDGGELTIPMMSPVKYRSVFESEEDELDNYHRMILPQGFTQFESWFARDNDDIAKNRPIVLCFWRSKEELLPRLARLAKLFYSIPPSTGSSERSFSHLNCIISKKVESLQVSTTKLRTTTGSLALVKD